MAPDSARLLSIGELSKATGVKIETIRYYERIGLLNEPSRTRGGNRIYGMSDAGWLGFIRRSRELGFPLDDVRALMKISDASNPDCLETREITSRQLAAVRGKIASLKRLERSLTDLTRRCKPGDQTYCPILETLFSD